jgi:hypothetical protein
MQYARQARDVSNEIKQTLDENGWYKHTISLGVVLLLTATAAISTGIVNSRLEKSQNCTERAFSATIAALNSRTDLSSDLSVANYNRTAAFQKLLRVIFTTKNKEEIRASYKEYDEKLSVYLSLVHDLRVDQQHNPFPKDVDYQTCLEGSKDAQSLGIP